MFRHDMRVSHAEREEAIEKLGSHFAEGRLTLNEYEARVDAVLAAQLDSDIDAQFHDLPMLQPGAALMPVYTGAEIERASTNSRRTKFGVVALTAVITSGLAAGIMNPMPLFFIPAVFVLVYLLQVGPKSWYQPSPRKLEKMRRKELRSAQWHHIGQQSTEITSSAVGYVHRRVTGHGR